MFLYVRFLYSLGHFAVGKNIQINEQTVKLTGRTVYERRYYILTGYI